MQRKANAPSNAKPKKADPQNGAPKTVRPVAMRIAVLCLILSLLVSSGIFTYARFTNSLQAQRTVAAYDAVGERFSSNYLQSGNGKNVRIISVASALETPMAVVTVCNYEQGRQMYANTQDIPYTLSLQLVKYDNVQGIYVDATSGEVAGKAITISNGNTSVTLNSSNLSDDATFSGMLEADDPVSDAYTVTFQPYQDSIFLQMTVTPDNETGLSALQGILKAGIRMAGASSSWAGSFQDSTASAPSAYDGFNYRVTGVGSGTFTLRWNSAYVEISAMSLLTLLSIDGAIRNGNSITFPVDAEEVSLYDLQFYKVNITTETWGDMTSTVVTYDFSGS